MGQHSRFLDRLQPSGWDRVLRDFVLSSEFDTLFNALREADTTTGITPNVSQIFRAFYECPYNELKVVILGQDPYPKKGVADGIAFSCGNTKEVQKSLKVMFKELEKTVGSRVSFDPDLKNWSNQGVLMLNSALTTVPGSIGKHYDMWKPFMKYLLLKLNEMNPGLIYVFMGAVATDWADSISETNYKLYCYHPASAAYSGGEWDSNDMFNRVNQILLSNNGVQIKW